MRAVSDIYVSTKKLEIKMQFANTEEAKGRASGRVLVRPHNVPNTYLWCYKCKKWQPKENFSKKKVMKNKSKLSFVCSKCEKQKYDQRRRSYMNNLW